MTETLFASALGSLLALTLWHVASLFGRRRAERLVAEENARLDRLTRDIGASKRFEERLVAYPGPPPDFSPLILLGDDQRHDPHAAQRTIDQIKRDRTGRMERSRNIYSGKPSGKESA